MRCVRREQKLNPADTTLINLASCREKQGELATAWGLFLDAERQTRSASDANTRQLHDLAADRAHKLEPRVSKLAINVPQQSMVDGLEVSRNGERIDPTMWNRAMSIDGGTYTIDAKAPGSSTWSTPNRRRWRVRHQDGRRARSSLAASRRLPTAEQPQQPQLVAMPPPPATAVEPQRSYTLPIAVGAGSLVVLGGALGLELWGEAKYNDAKQAVDPERNTLYDAANARRYAAEGVAVVGLLGAGAAVWLFVRDRGERHPARGVSIELVPTGAGLLVRGATDALRRARARHRHRVRLPEAAAERRRRSRRRRHARFRRHAAERDRRADREDRRHDHARGHVQRPARRRLSGQRDRNRDGARAESSDGRRSIRRHGRPTLGRGERRRGLAAVSRDDVDLALDSFDDNYRQASYARAMPQQRISFAQTLVTDRYVYVLGGAEVAMTSPVATNTITRARINADGTLGELVGSAGQLSTPRAYATSARIGNAVYLIGGVDNESAVLGRSIARRSTPTARLEGSCRHGSR